MGTHPQTPSGHPFAEVRETHSAVVFLIGDRAYKVKKAADLGFLDFRTVEARRRACNRELELNRRLAPDVYLDVFSVRGSDERAVEFGVLMRRMPEHLRLTALIESGAPVREHLRSLAVMVAEFHATAVRNAAVSAEGEAPGLRRRWEDNLRETETYRGSLVPAESHDRIRELALRYVDGRATLLSERAAVGLMVDGHGDLTAEDIFCLPDRPRVLDCIEFDDRLRRLDVLDDVAFLAMDLEHRGRTDLADYFLQCYQQRSPAAWVPSLAHHYMAYRAFVRAKVACIRARQGDAGAAIEAARRTQLALRHLHSGDVAMILVGGAPGTGKTTVARELTERLGCVPLSTDVIRREMPHFSGPDPYSDRARAAAYDELLSRARWLLERGRSVICDGTWPDRRGRDAAAAVAEATGSRLVALECQTPLRTAMHRAQVRLERGDSLSQAGADLTRTLATAREEWPQARVIDTAGPLEDSVAAALEATGPLDGGDGEIWHLDSQLRLRSTSLPI